MCGEEEEDIIHFTVKCKSLEKKRNNLIINTEILDPEERMKDLLFRNKDFRGTSRTIRDLWTLRTQLLKELEKDTIREKQRMSENHPTLRDPPQCGLPQSRKIEPPQCGTPQNNLVPLCVVSKV